MKQEEEEEREVEMIFESTRLSNDRKRKKNFHGLNIHRPAVIKRKHQFLRDPQQLFVS